MHYFLFLGIIELCILSFKDVKTLMIDSRYNYFMFGVVASMIAIEKPGIIYLIALIVATTFLGMFLSKFIASGDVESIGWCILGFGVMHGVWLVLFVVYLVLLVLFSQYVVKIVFRIKEKVEYPGMPIILGAFILTTTVIMQYS